MGNACNGILVDSLGDVWATRRESGASKQGLTPAYDIPRLFPLLRRRLPSFNARQPSESWIASKPKVREKRRKSNLILVGSGYANCAKNEVHYDFLSACIHQPGMCRTDA